MQHALVTIEQNAPAMQAAPLTQAAINGAAELVEMFADDRQQETLVKRLQALAAVKTTAEFSEDVKNAKKLADTIDGANGFTKPEGAKGQDAYGPKRQLLNSRLSEAKRVFGVAKMAPEVLKEKGYWAAVNAARKWLDDHGKTWDGNKALNSAEKAAKREQGAKDEILGAIRKEHPQNMGESLAAWATRVETLYEDALQDGIAQSAVKRVETIVASLKKQFGDEMPLLVEACKRIAFPEEAAPV